MIATELSTTADAGVPSTFADDFKVLTGRTRFCPEGPEPIFSEDRWDMSASYNFVTAKACSAVFDFRGETDLVRKTAIKEFAAARLTKKVPGHRKLPAITTVKDELVWLRHFYRFLDGYHKRFRLNDVTADILDAYATDLRDKGTRHWTAFKTIIYLYDYRVLEFGCAENRSVAWPDS